MILRNLFFVLLAALLQPTMMYSQGEIGSISLRTQGEIGFSIGTFDVPEIGNLRNSNEGFYQLQLDETVYVQLSEIFAVGIGAGLGWYHTREFNFFNGFQETSDASAFHLRTSLYSRFLSRFSDKMGMYHEIQFRYQIGKFERISSNDGSPLKGDVNILGLGYNPIIYYKLSDQLHLEAAIHGITLFRTRAQPTISDDFFIDLNIDGRLRMGLQMGLSYYFPVNEEGNKQRKKRKRKRR